MRIPLSYNLRSIAVRRATALMTAGGISLTVAVLLASLALMSGLQRTFESSGDPLNILVLRKGSTSELSSSMTREMFQDMLFKPGIAVSRESGRPMASLELVTAVRLPSVDDARGMSVTVRGLLPAGIEMRNARLIEGRWFQSGQREVVVGKSISRRSPHARPGGVIRFGSQEWQVTGIIDGGRSALNSEILGDLNQISSEFNRVGLSSALLRAPDMAAVPALVASLNDDQRLNAAALPEKDYYARQSAAGAPLRTLGIFVSAVMAIGSGFTAMNTMHAAVRRRAKEIGILRVLGFSRRSILASFLLESVLLALSGGVAACILVLPLNWVSTAVGNFVTMSEIAVDFRVSGGLIFISLAYSAMLGVLGGLLPARAAARKEILTALREG